MISFSHFENEIHFYSPVSNGEKKKRVSAREKEKKIVSFRPDHCLLSRLVAVYMYSDLYKERVAKWTAVMAKATGINHRTVGANYGTRMPWLEFFRDNFPHIFEEEGLSLECVMKFIEER